MRVFILYPFLLTLSRVTATQTGRAITTIGVHVKDAIVEGSSDAITATLRAPFVDLSHLLEGTHGDPLSVLDWTASDQAGVPDFWETAKKSEKTLREYAERLLEAAAAYFGSTEFTTITSTMHDIVTTTASFRESISGALEAHNVSLSVFTEELEGIFMKISDGLEIVSSVDNVPGPGERAQMANKIMDDTTRELVKLAARLKIEEDVMTTYLFSLRRHILRLIATVGDINDQCPLLLPVIMFCIVILLIPQMWILRPLLSLFGFGPLGPIKGSIAAFLQSYFWGGAVARGSWFALLQAAGMGVAPQWAWFVTKLPMLVGGLRTGILSCFNHA